MEFYSGKDLLNMCEEKKYTISDLMIDAESKTFGKDKEHIIKEMKRSYDVMKKAIEKSLNEDLKSMGGLIGGEAKTLFENINNEKNICGSLISKAMAYGMGVLEVNASMGLIVAAPTAGSCGIIPGVFKALQEEYNLNDDVMIKGLFNSAAVGMIISRNATVSGAEGGCQAETGSAAAMAASAVCEIMGGSPEQCLDAAAISLKNIMGLICDPIAGLVEAPCQKRNAIGVANAFISAEMALAGVGSLIPFDEVVSAMYKVGKSMPMELRETALGGVASSETGCNLCTKIFG